jgi:hypothetical protein
MSAISAKQMPPERLVWSCRWHVFGFRQIVITQAPAQDLPTKQGAEVVWLWWQRIGL